MPGREIPAGTCRANTGGGKRGQSEAIRNHEQPVSFGNRDIVTQGAYPGPNPSRLCKRPKNRRLDASLGLNECHLPEKCPHFVAKATIARCRDDSSSSRFCSFLSAQ